jgi:hypothetical protein
MSQRILCTNGTRTRLMGPIELRQNPDWRPVTDQDQNQGAAKPAAKEVRTPQPVKAKEVVSTPVVEKPKEVITPEAPVEHLPPAGDATEERTAEGTGEENTATEAQLGEAATLSTDASGAGSDDSGVKTTEVPPAPKQIGEVMKAIKACTTKDQVEALTKDETRKAILDYARSHTKKLERASKP